ncbi:MAG: hypothetical protein ACM3JJ_11740 [Hyphomicrobiales bacterium]
MAATGGFWERMQEEVRSVSERTRRGTRRAVRIGVLKVDLVSLRRNRTRALAHLGERALLMWGDASPGALDRDAEATRLRALIGEIDRDILAKEAELANLSAGADPEPAPPGPTPSEDDPTQPVLERSHPMSDDGRGPS